MHHDEERIDQFWEFAENEQLHPKAGGSRSVQCRRIIAEVVTKSVCGEVVVELRSSAESPDPREERQSEVPCSQCPTPTERIALGEVRPPRHDADDVDDARPDWHHWALLHVSEDVNRIIVLLKVHVRFAQRWRYAREFSVLGPHAILADAL